MKTTLTKFLSVLVFAGAGISAHAQNTGAVGSPKGTFSVSNMGAAQYHIEIEMPEGGPLVPEVGIDYSSQSGNGLAGYGFNISGIQSITRGGKDVYHDGQASGVAYNTKDELFLNGKRLIWEGGAHGYDGAVYTAEGDPYTKITLHGSIDRTDCWFSVAGTDGKNYKFGSTANSRLAFTDRSNASHTVAWYISEISDVYQNRITYTYTTSNYNIRPAEITYGLNDAKSRGITNKILFSYKTLTGNYAVPFAIGDRQGKRDACLTRIVTQTNNNVFRTYDFTYNDTSDATEVKYNRLVQVDMKNGQGDAVAPIKIEWDYMAAPSVTSSKLDVSTNDDFSNVYDNGIHHTEKETSKFFLAQDVNADGVSDIIRIAPFERTISYSGYSQTNHYTRVSICKSKISPSGNTTYDSPLVYFLPTVLSGDIRREFGGISAVDFDGDGYNDFVFPSFEQGYGNCGVFFDIIRGDSIAKGVTNGASVCFSFAIPRVDKFPLYSTLDIDSNGKDDFIIVEQRKNDGYYSSTIAQYDGTWFVYTKVKLTLPADPQKIFTGDYNNDGLTDLIVFYQGGYKIYFNNGGSSIESNFTESNTM